MGGVQWGSAADRIERLRGAVRHRPRHAAPTATAPTPIRSAAAACSRCGSTTANASGTRRHRGCGTRTRCSPAQSAAVSAIPGVAFSGSVDGHMRAYSTTDGTIVWDFDTHPQLRRPSTACQGAADRSTARVRRLAAAWCSSTPAIQQPAARPAMSFSLSPSTASSASTRVRSNTRSNLIGAWVFAVVWTLISAPLLFFIPRELERKPIAAIGFLFPIIGIGLLSWATHAHAALAAVRPGLVRDGGARVTRRHCADRFARGSTGLHPLTAWW